jgi:hypothetical protein
VWKTLSRIIRQVSVIKNFSSQLETPFKKNSYWQIGRKMQREKSAAQYYDTDRMELCGLFKETEGTADCL